MIFWSKDRSQCVGGAAGLLDLDNSVEIRLCSPMAAFSLLRNRVAPKFRALIRSECGAHDSVRLRLFSGAY